MRVHKQKRVKKQGRDGYAEAKEMRIIKFMHSIYMEIDVSKIIEKFKIPCILRPNFVYIYVPIAMESW